MEREHSPFGISPKGIPNWHDTILVKRHCMQSHNAFSNAFETSSPIAECLQLSLVGSLPQKEVSFAPLFRWKPQDIIYSFKKETEHRGQNDT